MEVDEDLAGLGLFIGNIEIGCRIQDQGFFAIETGEVQIVVQKAEQFCLVRQIFLPERHHNAGFRCAGGIGRGIGLVIDHGHDVRAVQEEGVTLGFLKLPGFGHQPGSGEIPVLFPETKGVIDANEYEKLEDEAAQDRAQNDQAGVTELVENIDQRQDDRDRQDVAIEDLLCHLEAVAGLADGVFPGPEATGDPDQGERRKRAPVIKIRQDAPRAVLDLCREEERENHDQEIQQQQQPFNDLIFHDNRLGMNRIVWMKRINVLFVFIEITLPPDLRFDAEI